MLINSKLKKTSFKRHDDFFFFKKKLLLRKGQAFGSDFLISLVIFIIILFACAELWNITVSKYSKKNDIDFMQKKALSITDLLIKNEGYPKDWTNNTVIQIGLSEETSHIISKKKLFEMKNISNSSMKSIWGVSDYNAHLNFTNSSGSTIVLDGIIIEYGEPPLQKKDLVHLRRVVIINDSGNLIQSVLTFIIWR